MKLAVLVVGVVVVVAVVVFLTRSGKRTTEPRDTTAAGTNNKSPAATTLPDLKKSAKSRSPAHTPSRSRPRLVPDLFKAETRDHQWATATEKNIRSKTIALLGKLPGDSIAIAQVECRSKTCRFHVTGSDNKLFNKFVETLQEPRGFYGFAKQLTLKRYRKGDANGPAQVTVVLAFKR